MTALRSLSLFSMILLLTSCVTINVYFPAAAAEKAADRIIEDVLGKDYKKGVPPENPSGSLEGLSGQTTRFLVTLLDWVISDAHAAGADINVSSPAINKLKASMQKRHQKLSGFYKAGAIGFGANGLVATRDASAVGLRERGELKKLLSQENRDRNALYSEIARVNGHPEWEKQIRETFARRWVANARSGWYYQDKGGAWHQK
ncbi:MAG: DUF1318 domain-containing protein [Gammaproteobacteria bacterium]|nr:MAG: DUF1318 domain-containing protein [Gammaproteobacteria bacterium]